MKMKKTITSLCLLSMCLFAYSQSFRSKPVDSSTTSINGKIYSLPKTKLIIKVKTKQTTITPGELYPYAESSLGIKNVCTKKETINEIESINIETKTIADTSKTYILYDKKKGTAPSCSITKDNILLSVNKITNKVRSNKCIKNKDSYKPKDTLDFMPYSLYTKEMQQSNSTARIADLAANKIFSLREARIKLLTQDSEVLPSQGDAYRVILNQLNKVERVYLDLFSGHKNVEYINTNLEVNPQEGKNIIFRFSDKLGVVSKNDLSGAPIYVSISKENNLSLKSLRESKNDECSLFYRNPAKAKISIFDMNKNYVEKEIFIPQFGKICTIPNSFSGKISLDKETGNIISIENFKK